MSRRQKTPASTNVMYALLKMKCPRGHELGALLRTRHSLYRMTREQLAVFKQDEEALDLEPLPLGQPVRSTCPICQREGRPVYWYAQPWAVVETELRAEFDDTHSAQRTLTLC
jgi:hypothetical protein